MYEIFLMLALFSLGPVERKTRFCFEMFDIDGSGELQMVRACAPSRSWSGVDLPKKVWWLTVFNSWVRAAAMFFCRGRLPRLCVLHVLTSCCGNAGACVWLLCRRGEQEEFSKFVNMIAESLVLIGEVRELPHRDTLAKLVDLCFQVTLGKVQCTIRLCVSACVCLCLCTWAYRLRVAFCYPLSSSRTSTLTATAHWTGRSSCTGVSSRGTCRS